MGIFFLPTLDHPQPNPWPLIHHADSESIQLLLASLEKSQRFNEDKFKDKAKYITSISHGELGTWQRAGFVT